MERFAGLRIVDSCRSAGTFSSTASALPRAGAVSFGQSKTRRREPAGSEFGRRLRIEPEKTVELFGMKQPTISIDNMDLPSGLKQSASLRHSEYGAGEERSDALSVF